MFQKITEADIKLALWLKPTCSWDIRINFPMLRGQDKYGIRIASFPSKKISGGVKGIGLHISEKMNGKKIERLGVWRRTGRHSLALLDLKGVDQKILTIRVDLLPSIRNCLIDVMLERLNA